MERGRPTWNRGRNQSMPHPAPEMIPWDSTAIPDDDGVSAFIHVSVSSFPNATRRQNDEITLNRHLYCNTCTCIGENRNVQYWVGYLIELKKTLASLEVWVHSFSFLSNIDCLHSTLDLELWYCNKEKYTNGLCFCTGWAGWEKKWAARPQSSNTLETRQVLLFLLFVHGCVFALLEVKWAKRVGCYFLIFKMEKQWFCAGVWRPIYLLSSVWFYEIFYF